MILTNGIDTFELVGNKPLKKRGLNLNLKLKIGLTIH